MQTQKLRHKFLNYFRNQGHTIVPSSPVVPHGDPNLLFTNAGMNQFKDVFLGKSRRDYTRAATSQKCVRAGGKHNDLDNVGHTRRHCTFFEMLGNFSFGDYFKEDAIRFAWEMTLEVFGFDPSRIWASVFQSDDEAAELWKRFLPTERIVRFGEKENFWMMGETGPCGPCSELLYDRGPSYGTATNPHEDISGERFLEFWNLVFMQYNRAEGGAMTPLPRPSIDTGAGMERVVSLQMDVSSVYDTDVLRRLIAQVETIAKIKYDTTDARAPAFRVIADHLRCLSFAIADGAQPSNIERGYVLRKVLRRAVRYGKQLGFERPFLASVFPALIETMGEDYPELVDARSRIEEILSCEEDAFFRTLRRGGNILNQIMTEAQKHDRKISGEEAFKLKDTYGLPMEEILLLAKDGDLTVDTERFEELEEQARQLSKARHKATKEVAAENLFENFVKEHGETQFLGYTQSCAQSKVVALVRDDKFVEELRTGEEGLVLLESTPFYASMGGQVGDVGTLREESVLFEVSSCISPFKGLIGHQGKVAQGTITLGDTLKASINTEIRQKIANNHTATHLLHTALQKVLGKHAKQAGSLVEAERLRFDFSHHKALTLEEIRTIEDLVNREIRHNRPVNTYELTYEEAQKRQEVKQFFGEKYGAKVRVVDIDESKELCGGTHTSATGNIGLFRIVKEGSIAAGIRRIEAVTGDAAEALCRQSDDLLLELGVRLKVNPDKILPRLEKLLQEQHMLEDELKKKKENERKGEVERLLQSQELIKSFNTLIAEVETPPQEMGEMAQLLLEKLKSGVVVLGTKEGNRCSLFVAISPDLTQKNLSAHLLIQTLIPIIEGRGGGKAERAQAGGNAPQKLQEALEKAKVWLKEQC